MSINPFNSRFMSAYNPANSGFPYVGNSAGFAAAPQAPIRTIGGNDPWVQIFQELFSGGVELPGNMDAKVNGGAKSKLALDGLSQAKPESKATLSGEGKITGNRFRSPDGETYTIKDITPGKAYSLLSDGDLALNGIFKAGSGEGNFILSQVGLSIGTDRITFADDGTFLINGEPYSSKKNNLDGAVTKDGKNYVIKSGGYEFKFRLANDGVSVDINATAASNPDGLWGATFDGTKQKASEIESGIQAYDYRVANLLASADGKSDDDATTNDYIWKSRNQKYGEAWIGINEQSMYGNFSVFGPGYAEDDLNWKMKALEAGTFYNIFSDEGLQIAGAFESLAAGDDSQDLSELAIMTDDAKLKVKIVGGKLQFTDEDDNVITTATGLTMNGDRSASLSVRSSAGESYTVKLGIGSNDKLSLKVEGGNIGNNAVRSSGLLGDALGAAASGDKDVNNVSDLNGAGYLRDENGELSKIGQSMADGLANYQLSAEFDTESGYSLYR